MKSKLLLVALLLFGSSGARASDVPHLRKMFRWMDANNDREIQFSELVEARALLFDRLDANRDGLLDAEELRATAKRANDRRRAGTASADHVTAQAERMDADSDGRVSREEFSRFIPDRLARADANGDGSLSLRELRALRK